MEEMLCKGKTLSAYQENKTGGQNVLFFGNVNLWICPQIMKA